jgi:hypothetical protein
MAKNCRLAHLEIVAMVAAGSDLCKGRGRFMSTVLFNNSFFHIHSDSKHLNSGEAGFIFTDKIAEYILAHLARPFGYVYTENANKMRLNLEDICGTIDHIEYKGDGLFTLSWNVLTESPGGKLILALAPYFGIDKKLGFSLAIDGVVDPNTFELTPSPLMYPRLYVKQYA